MPSGLIYIMPAETPETKHSCFSLCLLHLLFPDAKWDIYALELPVFDQPPRGIHLDQQHSSRYCQYKVLCTCTRGYFFMTNSQKLTSLFKCRKCGESMACWWMCYLTLRTLVSHTRVCSLSLLLNACPHCLRYCVEDCCTSHNLVIFQNQQQSRCSNTLQR